MPVNSFLVGGRYVYLYSHPERPACANYILYWAGGENIQHAMTDTEVFSVLSQLLEEANAVSQKPETTTRRRKKGSIDDSHPFFNKRLIKQLASQL